MQGRQDKYHLQRFQVLCNEQYHDVVYAEEWLQEDQKGILLTHMNSK